jgi:hypothetical protein
MKKLIILFLALVPFVSNCEKDDVITTESKIREIAWNYLNEQSKLTVTPNWKEAPITEAIYNEKKVYAVSFNTKDDALLGPIVVYIDKVSLVALGQALRL